MNQTGSRLYQALLFFMLWCFASGVHAQDCPANVILAQARAGSVCVDTDRNYACFANGTVSGDVLSETPFAQPGDRLQINELSALRTADATSLALLQAQADIPDVQGRSVAFWLFGATEVIDTTPRTPEVLIAATGTINIRLAPDIQAEAVTQVGLRDNLIANGRTLDSAWYRVMIPGTNVLGWISPDSVAPNPDLETLTVVDMTTPFYRPYQLFTVHTGVDDAPCAGTPQSGLLLQAPSLTEPVFLVINGVPVRLAATVFIQANQTLTINVLDGFVIVGEEMALQYVPAGAQTMIPLGEDGLAVDNPAPAAPYSAEATAALPVNNLPTRVIVPAPISAEALETALREFAAAPLSGRPPSAYGSSRVRCVRTVTRDEDLRSGPASYYEVFNPIRRGTEVIAVLEIVDEDRNPWWQLLGGGWIRVSSVESVGDCPPVPISQYVPPPAYNYLSLETCETNNGPLRVGQYVTIDFRPPPWYTIIEAQEAPRIDPGRIRVGTQNLHVSASSPVQIAEERFVRTFSTMWTATAGTHRIVGERLEYRVICNVTVPRG
jgi:hypothetical protein